MLKFLGFLVKVSVFSVLILVLGNWLRWDGKTISDQVKVRMSHAESSNIISSVRNWADHVREDAQRGIRRRTDSSASHDEISSSERQKLRALIRELNSSHRNH